jgi:hypothetical protein
LDKVKDILIKVNFVSTTRQLATTHVEGVRALLDFLRPRYDGNCGLPEAWSRATTASPSGRPKPTMPSW